MTTVPFISQLNNAPRNDCGPACALMLARSVGKGLTDTVEQLSKELPAPREIDTEDDGTTASELAAMLKKLGCDPVLSPVVPYPHIALVDYAMLPVAQRYDQSGRTFGHWIVRLSDTEYHDPYAAHGNQVADAATLDAAIEAGAEKYWNGWVVKVGVRDAARSLPAVLSVTGTDGAGVNVRAIGGINAQKIGVMAEGRAVVALDEQSGWTKIQLVADPQSWANGWVKSDYLSANPAPVVAAPRKVLVGVNVITDTGALAEAERAGCKFALVMGGVSEAVSFARNHPDGYCMLRVDVGKGRWSADDFIRALGVSADMPSNLVLTLFNEADSWGSSPRELEERMRVEVEFVRKVWAMGFAGIIALGTFSVGNPQFAPNAPEYAETVRLIRRYYTPLWNARLIGLDYHAYAPSMAHIFAEDLVWHERRWQFFFTDCGFDPAKGQGVFFGECGVDEDGVGGLPAHNANAQQIRDYIARFVEIQSRPVVVNGVSYPSPVRGGAMFCYGNNGDPRWRDGYDVRRFGVAPFVGAGVWLGARRLSRAAKAIAPKG
jgi:hypothetical protein